MTSPVRRCGVAVIGGGPAGLMAADTLLASGASVTLFDRMPSLGRKLLLAGRGGLNLTHSETTERFVSRYGAASAALEPTIRRFGPDQLRAWCSELGIETFVGTSGRVFPASFKTSPLLRAWLRRLNASGLQIRVRHRWQGWDGEGRLHFDTPEGQTSVHADAVILALGGASWPHLGSDGSWVETLRASTNPLAPANCGFETAWSSAFRDRFQGEPLKTIQLGFAGRRASGDAIVTTKGIEGGPVYALAPWLREAITADGTAELSVALRPDMEVESIVARLKKRRPKDSLSNALRKTLGLAPVAIGLLHEAARGAGTSLSDLDAPALAERVNAVPIRLTAPMPLSRAISTAGGVRFADLCANLMLRPGLFVAGEMLDWEAPTGGYLLQACFATGVMAGKGALAWLKDNPAKVEADDLGHAGAA